MATSASVGFSGVTLEFPGRGVIFRDLSIHLEAPQGSRVIAVMGASGCGKTTLLRLLAGMEKASAGAVHVNPEKSVGYLQQEPVLFEHLGRRENAAFYSRLRAQRSHFDKKLVDRLSAILGLEAELAIDQPVGKMSGGELRRLCLLRALSVRPSILLLDEPCNGLDPAVRQEFLVTLREALSESPGLVLYASHHPDEALLVADELLFMTRAEPLGVTEVSVAPMNRVLLSPSLELARFFASPYLNVMKLAWELIATLLSPGQGQELRRRLNGATQPAVTLAFEPKAVQWTDGRGVAIVSVAQSGHHCIAKRTVEDASATHIVGPVSRTTPRAFVLSGEVLAFDSAGRFLDRLHVEAPISQGGALSDLSFGRDVEADLRVRNASGSKTT